jgi:hypothetical protein
MGGWRKLHNKELRDLYPSSSIIRIVKSRSLKLTRRVTQIERRGYLTVYWLKRQRRRDQLEHQDIGRWIILRLIFDRYNSAVWAGLVCLRRGTNREIL